MALKPKRRRRESRHDIERIMGDEFLRRHLLEGHPLLSWCGFDTKEELLNAWALVKHLLLPEFIKANPGRRPFSWWLERGEERPIIRLPGGMTEAEYRASRWCAVPSHFGFLHSRVSPPHQEDEYDYLHRHGLLSPEEIEAHQQLLIEVQKFREEMLEECAIHQPSRNRK